MKRSLKETLNKKSPSEQSEAEIPDDVMGIVDKYSGMSEEELMNVLLQETSRQKKEGKFDRSSLENGVSAIMPMLNDEQKKKLGSILEKLN